MSWFARLGNDLYSGRRSVDFVGRRRLWYAVSGVIVILAVSGLYFRGLNMGIEFTGGAEYRISLPASQVTQGTADQVREAVAGTGIDNASAPVVTTSGDQAILVQTEPLGGAESAEVVDAILQSTGAGPDDVSQNELGASWGEEIAQRSTIGLVVFLVLVVLFIWAYFRQWKMSLAAMVALVHDVVITVGVYALSGFEVSPATVTGVLTILGFSLYDTVVVFDKVRENTRDLKRTHQTYAEAANLAVNQTLVRSINTSVVALIPVGAILYVGVAQLGSGSLKDLALALFVGMAAGAYSSIFIATPLLAHLKTAEQQVRDSDRRAQARRRHDADRYASVPAYADDMALQEEPRGVLQADPGPAPAPRSGPPSTPSAPSAPSSTRPSAPAPPPAAGDDAVGRGRLAPPAHGPLRRSPGAGRPQPTRQSRSKRGRK